MSVKVMSTLQPGDLTPHQMNAAIVSAVSIGTLYCFLGYRTVKFVLGLTGFLLAGAVAGALAGWIADGHTVAMAIAAVIGGVAGAFALLFLYRVGIFCLGGLGATLVAHNLLSVRPEGWIPLAVLGLGLVGGLVALLVERPVVTVATAVIGAWSVVSGVAYFLLGAEDLTDWEPTLSFEEHRTAILASWGVLALAGTLAQFATRKRPAPTRTAT